jgi:hypothetical protein
MGGSVDDSQLRSCFTSCRVKGKKDVGGIIGKSTQSYLKECYSVGIVSGSVNVGGLCGHRKYGEFQESFFAGNVSGDDFSGGLIGYDIGWMMRNCYQWLWSGPVSGNGIALTEDEMVLQSSYSGFNFVNDCAKSGWILEAGFLPRLSWQEYQKSCLPRKCRIETSLSGEGTYSAPFLIMNKTDFLEFCTNRFLDRGYYVLESDMDLSNEVYETSLVNRSFGGFFNGNGHVISGVNIKPAGEQKDYIGIFSHVTAQVENLHIKGLTLDGVNSSFTGGLCGRCQAGTIKNCSVDCSVMADQKVGGICGELYYGRIKGCHVKGTVKGHSEVGGVCGKNNMGLIQSTKSSSNVYVDD